MVCLSYLDSSPAHMRYTIRRLRRKLPNVRVFLGCWALQGEAATLRETVKADEVGTTLRDVVRLCLEAARAAAHERQIEIRQAAVTDASAAHNFAEAAM
jgi:hypothetical protein